jgi:hypothetical protein
MKLNDTTLLLNARTRCCLNAFVEHFAEPEQPEDPLELIASQAEFNPDVEVGDNFTCPHCKNTVLLPPEGSWVSLPADDVVDLTDPAPVVAVELTNQVSVV